MIVKIREIMLFTRATPGSSLVANKRLAPHINTSYRQASPFPIRSTFTNLYGSLSYCGCLEIASTRVFGNVTVVFKDKARPWDQARSIASSDTRSG